MASPRFLLAANWKMNLDLRSAQDLCVSLQGQWPQQRATLPVIICPPAPYLVPLRQHLNEDSSFRLGGQNLHQEEGGAFTGEVSGQMLRSCGATHVIVGHSERRRHFGESNALLREKLQRAWAEELVPIYCVGETEAERDAGQAEAVITAQLTEALPLAGDGLPGELILAYEPVWAIGTGRTATPEQAQEVHAMIRHWLSEQLGTKAAAGVPILYGGSVKPDNAAELFAQPDIDGGLVGGASLKAEDFVAIAQAFPKA